MCISLVTIERLGGQVSSRGKGGSRVNEVRSDFPAFVFPISLDEILCLLGKVIMRLGNLAILGLISPLEYPACRPDCNSDCC